MFTSLITLLSGIILGLLLATLIFLYFLKIKCPQCKQLKPLKEIIFFHWKSRIITGQACLKCQQVKPQVSIEL